MIKMKSLKQCIQTNMTKRSDCVEILNDYFIESKAKAHSLKISNKSSKLIRVNTWVRVCYGCNQLQTDDISPGDSVILKESRTGQWSVCEADYSTFLLIDKRGVDHDCDVSPWTSLNVKMENKGKSMDVVIVE